MMNYPLQIGITGGIGSGKSLVCKIFSVFGIPIYDADSHAKDVMTTDIILVTQIKKEFGDLSYLENGQLNRAYLSEEVFHNSSKLEKLNALVHPRVALHYKTWCDSHQDSTYVIKEAALLIESGSYKQLDEVILVTASEELRIQRVLKRDPQRSREQVEAIIQKQLPEEEKKKFAKTVLVNNEQHLLVPQVVDLHKRFLDIALTR
jgi:dephospho-CoA kinase